MSMLTDRLRKLQQIKNGPSASAGGSSKPSTQTAPSSGEPAGTSKPRPSFLSPSQEIPPWANPECPACSGYGFNSEKRPCRICNGNSTRLGKPSGEGYYVEEVDGILIWEKLGSPAASATPVADALGVDLSNEEENPFDQTTAADDTEEEPEPEPEAPEPAPEPEPEAPEPAPEGAPKKRGRPKGSKNKEKPPVVIAPSLATTPEPGAAPNFFLKAPEVKEPSLTLIVNAQVATGQAVVSLDSLFRTYSGLLAQALSAPSYYHIPAGRRRDSLAAVAPAIAALHNGQTVVGRMDTNDMVNFVAALRPYCTTYVEGTGANV